MTPVEDSVEAVVSVLELCEKLKKQVQVVWFESQPSEALTQTLAALRERGFTTTEEEVPVGFVRMIKVTVGQQGPLPTELWFTWTGD